MDAVTEASARDLIRRLRLAGDKHSDLRCLLAHKIDVPHSMIYETYGGIFGDWCFVPLADLRDWWELFFYFESSHDGASFFRAGLHTDEQWMEREQNLQEAWKTIRPIVKSLFDDAAWLLYSLGPSRVPGIPTINVTKLNYSDATWMWLLFQACWACPSGTILRSGKWFPKQWTARIELHRRQALAAGFEKPNGTFEHEKKVKAAIRDRQKSLSREDRENEWRVVYEEIYSQAKSRLEGGEYVSTLPCDPFTASAALIEFLVISDDSPRNGNSADGEQIVEREEWSVPMSESAIARKLKDDKHARPRDVKSLLAQYGVQKVGARKCMVRLDKMDHNTRRRFEAPN